MGLSRGATRVVFAGGINTKTDSKAVPSTQLLKLENGVFTKATSLRKRYGYTEVGNDPEYIRLATRDDELLAFTSDRCYSLRPDAADRSDAGSVYALIGADRPVVRTGTEQTMPDHATNGGISVYAWEDSRGGVYYTVTDETSGRIIIAATQADANGISPRCVAVGGVLHVYWANTTLGRISIVVVNPLSPGAAVTPQILTDDLNTTNPVYDACPTTRANTPALIAWSERGTTRVRIGYVDQSGALGTPLNGNPSVVLAAVGLTASSPIAVAYADDEARPSEGTVAYAYLTASGGTVTTGSGGEIGGNFVGDDGTTTTVYAAPVSVQRIALAAQVFGTGDDYDPTLWVAFEEAAVQPSNRYVVVNTVSMVAGAGTQRTIRSVGLASRAWQASADADVFAVFVHDTTYFNTYVALRLSDSLCVARILPGLAGDAPARRHLSSAHVVDGVVSIALPYNERVDSENGDEFEETGIRLVTLDYESEDSHQHAQLGRGLYLGAACPLHYDGRQWTEQGFHVGPELITTANGTSGSLTAASTYLYRCWYESTDAQGEVHRGPVSFGTLVTLGGGEDEVTLTLPTLRITNKTNVRIVVARSRAAETGKTAELYVCSSQDPTVTTGANRYVTNDATVDTVTFIDRMSDAVLEVQEPAYTNGGILSTDPSALGHVVIEANGRLFFTDPSDGNAIRYSQTLEPGYGVEIPPEFVIPCPPFGGDVSALAAQDGTVLVFKRDAILAFGGEGPLPNGDTATTAFSSPRVISSDVGCTDPASIVLTPQGHVFKSAKGLYLIDRSGQVGYVGAPAEGYNSQRVTAATVMPDRTQIVLLTDEGTTLLYDFLFGQWSTFTNHLGLDGAVVSNTYHYLRTDGRVFREAIGSYTDAGLRITLRMETAWIHLAEAIQGFQRFWGMLVLGTWLSPHQLGISSRVDYAPGQEPTTDPTAWSDPQYLDATGEDSGSLGWISGDGADTIGEDPILGDYYGDGLYGDGVYGGSGPDVYQWRYYIGGRGQSVQFRFEDFERDGLAGPSFELTELLIEGGVAGPAKKPFSAARSA